MDSEDHVGDLLLGRSVAVPVEGLHHSPRAKPLLRRQTGVRRNRSAMDRREQAIDGGEAVEALKCQRHNGSKRLLCC